MSAPALVFLHYFAGSARSWAGVIAAIGDDRRCLALDLRGFGGSAAGIVAHSLDLYADDVEAAVASGGLDRFILVGHSMGGKIAMAFAGRHPPGLAGLILIAPSPPTPQPMSDDERREQLAAFGDRTFAEALPSKIARRPIDGERRAGIVDDTLATSRSAWNWWLLRGSRDDIAARAVNIDTPTQVVSGSLDPAIPPAVVRREVVGRIPGATFTLIPGVGHLAPYEAAEDVAELIRSAR